jgi:hypothetical protein
MKLLDGVFFKLHVRATELVFLGALSLSIGCVSLDKPALVEECATKGNCSNEPIVLGPDAKDATDDVEQPRADVRIADEPVGGKADLGPDSPALPDASPDKADASSGKQDVSGPESSLSEVAVPGDVGSDSGAADSIVLADVSSPDIEPDVPDPSKQDVAKDDVAKDDVVKQDVVKEDVTKDDVVKEDVLKEDVVKEDVTKEDVSGPEVPRDLPPDSASNCSIFYGSGSSQGHPPAVGSTDAFCIATCDDIAGWGCSNFDGRTVTVNGAAVKCGDTITKKNGYIVFQVSAGTNVSAGIYWWVNGTAWATTCTAPAGGF